MAAGRGRRALRGSAVLLAAAFFLALSGAFTSAEAPFAQRLSYWLPVMLVGGLWSEACTWLTRRFIDMDERPWLGGAVLTGIMAGPLAVMVWALTGPLFGQPVRPLSHLPHFLVPVTAVCAAVTAIIILIEQRPVRTRAGPDAPPARFPGRLPPKLRGAAIHAVQAEDHYLRVHTDRGSDLILMRLSDALEELQGLEGAQTHRSWWVARDAVVDVARGDGRAVLTLRDGITAPVSRRHSRALRAAGWY